MKVTTESALILRITDVPRLDPITVVVQDYGQARGQLMVACYGCSWVAYWGAMGGDSTVLEFVGRVSADYIANSMWDPNERRTKHRYAYVTRIAEAVQEALREVKP